MYLFYWFLLNIFTLLVIHFFLSVTLLLSGFSFIVLLNNTFVLYSLIRSSTYNSHDALTGLFGYDILAIDLGPQLETAPILDLFFALIGVLTGIFIYFSTRYTHWSPLIWSVSVGAEISFFVGILLVFVTIYCFGYHINWVLFFTDQEASFYDNLLDITTKPLSSSIVFLLIIVYVTLRIFYGFRLLLLASCFTVYFMLEIPWILLVVVLVIVESLKFVRQLWREYSC